MIKQCTGIYVCPSPPPTIKPSLIGNNCCCVVRPVSSSGRKYGRQLLEGCSVLSRSCLVVSSVFRETLWAERKTERSGRKLTWVERWAGTIYRSNPLQHKTTQSKKFKIEFKSYHETVSVDWNFVISRINLIIWHITWLYYAALWSGYVQCRK